MSATQVGKAVIVTGAASGIGAATVAGLYRRGARILAADINASAIAILSGGEGKVLAYEVDVSDAAAVKAMVNAAVERFGELNAIFNNAGIFGSWSSVSDYPDDVFDRVFAVNVRGVQLGMKYAIPALRAAGGGRIVNTASLVALGGAPNASAYVAAKHAVLGLSRCAGLELRAERIAVNALCPGGTKTPMLAEIHEAASLQSDVSLIPPEEIAEVAVWLLLDAPNSLTGVPVTVAGGFPM